jgi:hypothetical protein
MFKRIIYDEWTNIVPIISFCLTFGVFLAIVIRTLLLKKTTVSHMENLPLEDGNNSTTNAHSK